MRDLRKSYEGVEALRGVSFEAIMQKLDVHSRLEAIRVAEERGWL